MEWERYGCYEHFQILAYPPPLPPPVFDADKVYAPLMELGAAVETLSLELSRSEVKYLCQLLVWSRPFQSACSLACWLYFAAYYLDCLPALLIAALACFILLCRAYPSTDNAPAAQEEPIDDRRRERHLSRTTHYLSLLLPFEVRKTCRSLQEPLAVCAGMAQEVANLLTGRHTWSLLFAALLLFIAAFLLMRPPVQVTPAGQVTFATVGTLAFLVPSGVLQMAIGSYKYLDSRWRSIQVDYPVTVDLGMFIGQVAMALGAAVLTYVPRHAPSIATGEICRTYLKNDHFCG